MILRTLSTLIAVAVLMLPGNAAALTMDQFAAICESGKGECSSHPILQAYVGGALDLIAMLDEETDYLGKVYCETPSTLFDVPTIIGYMEAHREAYASKNAMLLVIRYLEEEGGC